MGAKDTTAHKASSETAKASAATSTAPKGPKGATDAPTKKPAQPTGADGKAAPDSKPEESKAKKEEVGQALA